MSQIYIGCVDLRGALDVYPKKLRFLELSLAQPGYPRLKTLAALRAELGEACNIALHASPFITHPYDKKRFLAYASQAAAIGFFQDTEIVRNATIETLRAARAIQANVILFDTPPSFTPSQENAARFLRFFAQFPKEGFICVWNPHGPWEFSQSQELALEAGVQLAFDPLAPSDFSTEEEEEESIWQGDIAYFRLKGPSGRRRRYTSTELEDLLELATQYHRAYIAFAHTEAFHDALALETLLQQTPEEDLTQQYDDDDELEDFDDDE